MAAKRSTTSFGVKMQCSLIQQVFIIKNQVNGQWLYCAEEKNLRSSDIIRSIFVCLFWIGPKYIGVLLRTEEEGASALLMCHISVCPIIYNEWIQSDGKWQSPAHLRISTLNRWSLKTCRIIGGECLCVSVWALAMKNYVYFWCFVADHKTL